VGKLGNNGAGKRRWFISRDGRRWVEDGLPRYQGMVCHRSAKGNIVRYASRESAQRVADRLNAQLTCTHKGGRITINRRVIDDVTHRTYRCYACGENWRTMVAAGDARGCSSALMRR